jgi:CRISPR-associated protein Csb2
MTSHALLIEVHLLGRRWHGVGDWPPSPFRLFQALVAGAYGARWRREDDADKDAAFRWLERLPAPVITAPPRAELGATTYFVPNNDLDAVAGDPRRVAEVRTAKTTRPILTEDDRPFLYIWPLAGPETEAERIAALAERLHTFGWGVDAAFARGELLDAAEAESRVRDHGGVQAEPAGGQGGLSLPWAMEGSLHSLKLRHAEGAQRFARQRRGRSEIVLFRQSRKPLFRSVVYDRPPTRLLFELTPAESDRAFAPRRQEDAALLTVAVRDLIARRLGRDRPAVVRFVIGRDAGPNDALRRIRIVPLPTIGHPDADPAIRRVLIELPPDCPLRSKDIEWAVSGQELAEPETGLLGGVLLVPSGNAGMLRHYGISSAGGHPGHHRWRTVTPCVLPEPRPRGRISSLQRAAAEDRAAAAVLNALRHAGVRSQRVSVSVQSEPFRAKGARAEDFHSDRFDPRRLRHVEVTLADAVRGPLVIGDGRWLGLGVMCPVRLPAGGLQIFHVSRETAPANGKAQDVARALRRAVMARVQAIADRYIPAGAPLPTFFTGHTSDGSPARSGGHAHLFYLAADADGDGMIDRLAVVSPDLVDRTVTLERDEMSRWRRWLEEACTGLIDLRAGRAGVLRLSAAEVDEDDPLFGVARRWRSSTAYRVTRHPRRNDDHAGAVIADVSKECLRRGLPRPQIKLLDLRGGPKGGPSAYVQLQFRVAVRGPLLIGAHSHFGGGLFARE